MSRTWINILTDDGVKIGTVTNRVRSEMVRTLNDIGAFEIHVPGTFDPRMLGVDRIVEFWRKPPGSAPVIDGAGFMRFWEWYDDADGNVNLVFGGPDQMELLDRRIVMYRPDTDESHKEGPADDVMKAVVRENLGPLAGDDWYAESSRDNPPSLWSVAPDQSLIDDTVLSFPWRNVFNVCRELALSSRDRGSALYFDCEYQGQGRFQFKTWATRRGIDRSVTSGVNPVIFSKNRGNLRNASLRFDWADEINYIIAGGAQLNNGKRNIDPEDDKERQFLSVWNRREAFVDAREEEDDLALAARSKAAREAGRPTLYFTGEIVDSDNARYGRDWQLGDVVTVRHMGFDIAAEIETVSVRASADAPDEVVCRFNVETLFQTQVADYPFP